MHDVDWAWVRTWAGRIFFAALPLGIFMYLSAAPVIRPGGVVDALPQAIGVGVIVAVAITAVATIVLIIRSRREQRRK